MSKLCLFSDGSISSFKVSILEISRDGYGLESTLEISCDRVGVAKRFLDDVGVPCKRIEKFATNLAKSLPMLIHCYQSCEEFTHVDRYLRYASSQDW